MVCVSIGLTQSFCEPPIGQTLTSHTLDCELVTLCFLVCACTKPLRYPFSSCLDRTMSFLADTLTHGLLSR